MSAIIALGAAMMAAAIITSLAGAAFRTWEDGWVFVASMELMTGLAVLLIGVLAGPLLT
jgi:hypothetical protein